MIGESVPSLPRRRHVITDTQRTWIAHAHMSTTIRRRTDVKLALVAGLTITGIAVLATLLHAPSTIAGTNGITQMTILAATGSDTGACQTRETLPGGTSAIRLGLEASMGPQVTVKVLSGSQVVTQGMAGPGWAAGELTFAVRPVRRTYSHVTVCFRLRLMTGDVRIFGERTPLAVAATSEGGGVLPGRMKIEYLRPGPESWWSLVPAVVRHMGLGRAASGTWIVVPIAALAAAVVALASWAVLGELR